jgi:branched-chain amino acid transport system substrate-binding protein
MEQEDADILVGPLSGDEGIAVANYAKEHPDKTFINGIAGAQDSTLKVGAPNFYRFHPDGAQWSAGLGDYAYNDLGWKKAAIIGDDYSFPYTSLAGFVAEYCATGGEITKRIWAPLGEKDYSSYISQIPDDVDGLYVGIGGSGLINFVKQYRQQKGDIDTKKMMGNVFWDDPLVLKEVGNSLIGGTTAAMTAGDSTDAEVTAYLKRLEDSYGKEIAGLGPSVFTYGYYTAGQALVKALEESGGDVSDQKALQDALAATTLSGDEAPYGDVKLDDNHQAISNIFVKRIVKDKTGDGVPDVETFRRIPDVDQTFGGFFSAESPAPDRSNPKCEKRTPPPWVGNAEEVSFK